MVNDNNKNIYWIPSDWLLYISSILNYCISKGTRNKSFVTRITVSQPLSLLEFKNGY